MTVTYNTGKKELIFVEVPEGAKYQLIHDGTKLAWFTPDYNRAYLGGKCEIIGPFKDFTEEQCRELYCDQQAIEIAIKFEGLDPEKTLIVEKMR